MKFSTEDCDLFSRKILYPIEQNNTKLKISGMIITICVLFGFCFLFIVYNFIYSFDKINEKIEKQTNILSFYRKSYDYNDINSSINTTLYKDPYYFIAGKVEDYDNKKSEIGEQFYKKKEFCGNVGILGIGVLIIDTITNKHILLNDSNLQLNIKYYNDSNFVDINDVSTYPCSEMIDKLGNETHTELLNIYQCFGFNVTITKQLNLIDNISTISHENIDITIKSIIDNVYISLIQIEQKHLSYNKPQITIKTTNINIRKGYRTTLNTFYQNVYYKYIPISMGVSSTHPYYSGYENINSTMSLSNNEDSSYGQFTVKYYLVDEVKTINFYCQSLIVK